uniref:Monodehydroascorbate reductase n=1 Tax=Tanacetum cinerariifolium TaxID=118510 RepID=A0A699HN11_TANCI|nr:hypothetical protein [Tanacetum cinerariifolium]
MNPVATKQVALDNSLVPSEKRLKIEKCNARIEFSKPQREETYQVTLNALKLSSCYPAFLIEKCNARIEASKPQREETYQVTLDALKLSLCYLAFLITPEVPKVYMHQFWNTIQKIKDTDAYWFKLDKKKFRVDTEVFREILQICLRLHNQAFVEPPSEEELNVDYVALLWEEFTYQADNREISSARKEHMPYPRFTKVIISHFISKNKTISMRNRINLYTICDDTLLGTLKFVSKTQDCQQYGALIPDDMINQDVKDSKAYKTYYNSATVKATPKKARNFKKVASPSRKLSYVLEKKRKLETHKLHASGSGDGVGSQPKVPDEQKDKTTSTDEGTDSDDDNDDDSDEVTKDDDDDDVESDADDDKEAKENEEEYVRNPDIFEFNDDDEEYEELYKDVNERLTYIEHEEQGKEDGEMTDASHDDNTQQNKYDQVKDDEHVTLTTFHDTQKTKYPMQSSPVSFDFKNQFLNLDNTPPTDSEVISVMNVKVRHEEPSTQTPPLLNIPVMVILKTSFAVGSTIPPTIPLITPLQQQSTPTPTPTPKTTTTTTSVPALLNFSPLFRFDQRVSSLEKEPSQLKQANYSAQLLETIKSQIPAMMDAQLSSRIKDSIKKSFKSYPKEFEKKAKYKRKRYIDLVEKSMKEINKMKSIINFLKSYQRKYLTASLTKFELKKILLDKIQKVNRIEDLKNTKISTMHWSNLTSLTRTSLNLLSKSSGKSAQAKKPVCETADTEMSLNQGEDLGNTDDQPNIEAASKDDWFNKPKRSLTLDSDWNTTKTPKVLWYTSNRQSKNDVFFTKGIIAITHVKVMKWYDYGYLEEIIVPREDQQLYNSKKIIKDDFKNQLLEILPKEVSDYVTPVIQNFITESLENIVLAKFSSQPKSTYEATASITEFELKKILLDKILKIKSYRGSQEYTDLYDVLVKSYKLEKDLFESYGKVYSLKRDLEDKDKDEDPPAGLDQGSSKGSKSYSKSSGKSAQAEELVFETTDIDMPLNQREDLGNTYDQPNVEVASKDDRFKKPERPLTSDLDWNTTKSIDFKQPQTWINKISKEGKPPRTFDELMSTPIDFSAYIKPLPLIEDQGRQVVPANYFINNDLEYLKGGSSIRQYTTSTTKTKAAKYDTIKSIEDMVPSLWSLVKACSFMLYDL